MSTIAEIESALSKLPVKDAQAVADWLQDYLDAKWDKQMDEDVAAGRLDHAWEKAKGDIATGRVKALDEVLNDRQVNARKIIGEMKFSGSEKPVPIANTPLRLSATPSELRRSAPALGEHTDEVLSELGYTAEEIGSFRQANVV